MPPARAGLGSSMVNTSRQIGSVLGIAVLGAIVQNQEASNFASRLVGLHIPAGASNTIATTIASAGASAGQIHLSDQLPIPVTALHTVLGQSLTDALHASFVISGVALLCVALLSVALLRPERPLAPAQTAPTAPPAPDRTEDSSRPTAAFEPAQVAEEV